MDLIYPIPYTKPIVKELSPELPNPETKRKTK